METIVDNQDIRVIKLTLSKWETNAYILVNPLTNKSALIDVPSGAPSIMKLLKGTELEWIMLTHNHQDHTGGLKTLREKMISAVVIHHHDNKPWLPAHPDMEINDQDRLFVGGLSVHVMHTPGHTAGSVCFLVNEYLFAGDTVFPGGPGYTETAEDFKTIIQSINQKILNLPDKTLVLPGHGTSTTIKKVKKEYAVFAAAEHSQDLCGDVTWSAPANSA